MDMFEVVFALPALDVLVTRAKAAITNLFKEGHPCVCAWSSGKDSSVVLAIALEAAREFREAGGNPYLVVTTSDTKCESPEIWAHIREESVKFRQYAKQHDLRLEFYISEPSIMSTWQIRVLSGRGLPSYAGTQADCSIDLKINPQRRLRAKLFRKWKKSGLPEPVTLLGTRYAESQKRALAMQERGEHSSIPVRNKDGELVLSPICMWDTDTVWEFIAEVSNSIRVSYTDFSECLRIYADAGGTSCAVVSDALLEGLGKSKKQTCSARTGCWNCQQAYDKSLRTMVESEPRYRYAAGLVRFNEYLRNIRWDWARRHWVGRTVKAGYVAIQPDTFHPREVRAMARMLMQLDFDERQRASREGDRVRFQILPLEYLITLDALWSKNALAKPFSIWADLNDIENGVRYDIPETTPVPETPIPDAMFLEVGEEWADETWDGLRDVYVEGLLENASCAPRIASDGLWELDTETQFSVDPEGAEMLLQFEVPYLLDKYRQGVPPGGITSGFKHYVMLGTISVSHSQRTSVDVDLRRSALKDRLGLTLEYDLDKLLKMAVRFSELPDEARKAWGSKATTESAQAELLLAA